LHANIAIWQSVYVETKQAQDGYEETSELFRALASPIRIALVAELAERQQCVHELVDALDLPQPLISQHLRVLRGADLVEGDRQGREVIYRVTDDHVAHIVLDAVRHAKEAHIHDEHH
jgi:ArsR family transcriptional regulator